MTLAASSDFLQTPVTVETIIRKTPTGTKYATAVQRSCYAEDGRKLVTNAAGEQVVATTTLYPPITDAALFTVDSRVTVNGNVMTILTATRRAIGDPDVDHVEVALA